MMQVTMKELAAIARAAGHQHPTVAQSRRGWFGTCGCGFRSPRTPDQATAEQLVADHIVRSAQRELAKQKASGRIAV